MIKANIKGTNCDKVDPTVVFLMSTGNKALFSTLNKFHSSLQFSVLTLYKFLPWFKTEMQKKEKTKELTCSKETLHPDRLLNAAFRRSHRNPRNWKLQSEFVLAPPLSCHHYQCHILCPSRILHSNSSQRKIKGLISWKSKIHVMYYKSKFGSLLKIT